MPDNSGSEVYAIADRYVTAYAALDPIEATDAGIAGHEDELTDFSPDANTARDDLDRDTLRALAQAPIAGDRDRIAADVMPLLRRLLRREANAGGGNAVRPGRT